MEFSGLISKYPVGRPLSEAEKIHRLKQKIRLNIEPHYQLSVIKLNSTFLDSVDKWYGWRGMISAVTLGIIVMFISAYIAMVHVMLTREDHFSKASSDLGVLISVAFMFFPLLAAAIWLLCKESFAYTHYPIRFDRKNKVVHVFRTNGTIMSAKWEEVFFTLGHLVHANEWEVRGHILGPDKNTVIETFALSYAGSISISDKSVTDRDLSSEDFVRAHWEFVRRYMEDGPKEVSPQVQFCMPIDNRKEPFRVGMERIFANFAGAPFLFYWSIFPFCALVGIARIFAMRTSRVPRWPAEIEASCAIEPDDPYAFEAAHDGARIAVFPNAAIKAGVGFRAQLSGL